MALHGGLMNEACLLDKSCKLVRADALAVVILSITTVKNML